MSTQQPVGDVLVASPCIGVCELDQASTCTGCGRLITEIAEWSRASEQRRRQIARDAQVRRARREQGAGTA